jgi:hypothetical protein
VTDVGDIDEPEGRGNQNPRQEKDCGQEHAEKSDHVETNTPQTL